MKITLQEIREMVSSVLAEAKKKKEKSEKAKKEVFPAAYSYSEAFDFSAPLGAYNLYRSQGAANWGPMTGPGTKVDDRVDGGRSNEATLRSFIKESIKAELKEERSAWTELSEMVDPPKKAAPTNVWEAAQHWYDHQGFGLGRQTSEGIQLKKDAAAKKAANKKK